MVRSITYNLLFSFVALLFFMPAAQAQSIIKDEFYFMQDDQEFTAEEMDEEALYIHDKCERNSLYKIYYDCGCIAGAFRQEREKQGPYLPQGIIYNSLFNENERGCTNTVGIAGDAFQSCMNDATIFREREKNNKEYCECVARTTAKNFKKAPALNIFHIENLEVDARISCDS